MSLADFTGKSKGDGNDQNNGSGQPHNAGYGGFGSVAYGSDDVDVMELLINYNEKFKNAGPIMYRDKTIKKTLSTLIGKLKPAALLIGEAGVGKTKIAEDIAYRLANDDALIPDILKGYTVYELPIINLVSGSGLLGDLEKKTKAVVDFVSNKSNKAILFIDEIHQIVGGGSNNGHYQKIAQILKPALARGDFHVIGSTTLQERSNFYTDPAFNRRFSDILVDELTQAQTVDVIKASVSSFLKHYKNKFSISDDVIEKLVVIADKYSKIGSHRPDNAFTLLDRVIANEILDRTVREAKLKTACNDSDPMKAQMAQQALQTLQANPCVNITEERVRNIAIKLSKSEAQPEHIDFDALRQDLSVIEGQDDIVNELVKLLKRHDMNLFPKKKPLSILFTGTSGVGKTEVTKLIAKRMTGVKPIILNMTEYTSEAAISMLLGADKGLVGSEDMDELPLDKLESNPYQIVLLDELEKSSKAVQRIFMSVFDEGILKTKRGNVIDCSKAIFIATTNAAHKEVKNPLGFGQETRKESTVDIKELEKWFDAEFLNRFAKRYAFHSLSEDVYISIVKNCYARELARIKAESPSVGNMLKDTISDDDLDKFRKEYEPDFGARPVYNLVKEYIEDQI